MRRELPSKFLRANEEFRLHENLVDRIAYLLRRWRICGEIDARLGPSNTSSDLWFVLTLAHYSCNRGEEASDKRGASNTSSPWWQRQALAKVNASTCSIMRTASAVGLSFAIS